MEALVAGLVFLSVVVLVLAGDQIFILMALREIRKMAATIPEKNREQWLNEALNSMGDAKAKRS